jgi:hypothetical protein
MDNSLEEIQNELQFILSKREMENNMTTWKRGFMLFVDSIVALNSAYDPFQFKVDLSDWARDTHFDVFEQGKYDEVLEELILKWRGKVPMSPEMKLAFILGSSLVFGVMAKKKEAAMLAKRREEDRLMEERIRAQVAAQVAAQMQHFQAGGRNAPPPPSRPRRAMSQPSTTVGENTFAAAVNKQKTVRPHSPLQGPSRTDEDLAKLIQASGIDSTVADDDDSTLSTVSSDDARPGMEVEDNVPVPVPVMEVEPVSEPNDVQTPVSGTAPKRGGKRGASTAGTGRGRGRPRKNPLSTATGVTLENFQ